MLVNHVFIRTIFAAWVVLNSVFWWFAKGQPGIELVHDEVTTSELYMNNFDPAIKAVSGFVRFLTWRQYIYHHDGK